MVWQDAIIYGVRIHHVLYYLYSAMQIYRFVGIESDTEHGIWQGFRNHTEKKNPSEAKDGAKVEGTLTLIQKRPNTC